METDSFGMLGMARIVDAHVNAHEDGTPFTTEWPQHIYPGSENFENPAVRTATNAGQNVVPVVVPIGVAPVVGWFVTFARHAKLYQITAVKYSPANAKTITIEPALYHNVNLAEVVNVKPSPPVKYSPEMVLSQSYRDGVMSDRTIAIEEAWPDA